jgi:hypothetical protein
MTNMGPCFDTDHPCLPPLKKGVDDRNAIGGGIRFAATPQIPRPRSARPAPFSKGGNSKGDSACEPQINRLPPLKKGVDDRSAIGGGIRFAATPQIPRPRSARPAPFCKGGNSEGGSACEPQKITPFFIELSP